MSSTIVLRKRKHSAVNDPLVLHLSSDLSSSYHPTSESESEPIHIKGFPIASSSTPRARSPKLDKRYKCPHEGCTKAYTKPARLAEHERSHTGDRPFVCSTCNKSYLRETHLQAHARSHLPDSSRPFVCTEKQCEKRFWTAQHLRVHSELHKGEKAFKCSEPDCDEEFSKHHQLREHICTTHAPPGTKPYRCEHEDCDKSFMTAQQLRTHGKTHDGKRYTCVHPACTTTGHARASPTYYSTWTSLQLHMRTVHPPTCPHPSCNGKTFSAQKGLRAHLKIHEQRDIEEGLRDGRSVEPDEDQDEDEPLKKKKRRGGEVGRDFICEYEDCDKDFKSKKALTNHHNVNHLGRRDFVCTHADCKRAFGYKHLLQRHITRDHIPQSDDEGSESSDEEVEEEAPQQPASFSIDDITGLTYSMHAKEQMQETAKLACPHPDVSPLTGAALAVRHPKCQYIFSRAYDLRRHLRSEHGLDVTKERVDEWVRRARKAKTSEA